MGGTGDTTTTIKNSWVMLIFREKNYLMRLPSHFHKQASIVEVLAKAFLF